MKAVTRGHEVQYLKLTEENVEKSAECLAVMFGGNCYKAEELVGKVVVIDGDVVNVMTQEMFDRDYIVCEDNACETCGACECGCGDDDEFDAGTNEFDADADDDEADGETGDFEDDEDDDDFPDCDFSGFSGMGYGPYGNCWPYGKLKPLRGFCGGMRAEPGKGKKQRHKHKGGFKARKKWGRDGFEGMAFGPEGGVRKSFRDMDGEFGQPGWGYAPNPYGFGYGVGPYGPFGISHSGAVRPFQPPMNGAYCWSPEAYGMVGPIDYPMFCGYGPDGLRYGRIGADGFQPGFAGFRPYDCEDGDDDEGDED